MDKITDDNSRLNDCPLTDIHSEEMQDIIGRSSSGLDWVYVVLLALIFSGAIALFSSFECKDIIPVKVQITNTVPVVSLVTTSSGYVKKVFVADGEYVEEDAVLLTFADISSYQSVQTAKEWTQAWLERKIDTEKLRKRVLESSFMVGELQGTFSAYGMQLNTRNSDDEKLKILSLNLLAEIRKWESRYVITSPTNGRICYLPNIVENQYLNAGSLLGRIKPEERGDIVGKAFLPAGYLCRIESGSKCIVELPSYPSEEYGQLEGVVERISSFPIVDNAYLVDISFPNGLVTNIGREIADVGEQNGTASIVAKNQKLGNIVLEPLRKIFCK